MLEYLGERLENAISQAIILRDELLNDFIKGKKQPKDFYW